MASEWQTKPIFNGLFSRLYLFNRNKTFKTNESVLPVPAGPIIFTGPNESEKTISF